MLRTRVHSTWHIWVLIKVTWGLVSIRGQRTGVSKRHCYEQLQVRDMAPPSATLVHLQAHFKVDNYRPHLKDEKNATLEEWSDSPKLSQELVYDRVNLTDSLFLVTRLDIAPRPSQPYRLSGDRSNRHAYGPSRFLFQDQCIGSTREALSPWKSVLPIAVSHMWLEEIWLQ